MTPIGTWIAHLRRRRGAQIDALTDAQGAALALLAILLDREQVLSRGEFAGYVAGLASATFPDRTEGSDHLSSRWASCIGDVRITDVVPPAG